MHLVNMKDFVSSTLKALTHSTFQLSDLEPTIGIANEVAVGDLAIVLKAYQLVKRHSQRSEGVNMCPFPALQ
jgi:hypothetical protein